MYVSLPFAVVLGGNMFPHKIDDNFKDLPSVSGIADNILIVGYDADARDTAVY